MVALDSAARAPSHIRFSLSAVLIAGGLFGGICAAAVPLSLLGHGYEGWLLATRTTDEFAGLLLFIAFVSGPLARLFPHSFTAEQQLDRRRLSLGFAAAYAVYLLASTHAATADGQRLAAPQLFSAAFQFCMLAVMIATSDLWPAMGNAIWRRMHIATLWFFWLAYTFAYIAHFTGPHIPDSSYGAGLAFLVAALFIRHAAALKEVW
ncbi:MAG TPA: hypothetical protein VGM36_10645, partial [Rhizomicrobium sp.]